MKTICILATLLLGVTSENVFGKDNTRKPMATCPTLATINSPNPTDSPWNLDDIQGTAPYQFKGAKIQYVTVGSTLEAMITCQYLDSNNGAYDALTQFSSPQVKPYSCSFIINESEQTVCTSTNPEMCTVYCSH